jgi:hypothetical protein
MAQGWCRLSPVRAAFTRLLVAWQDDALYRRVMPRSGFPYVVLRDRRAPGGVPSRPHMLIINTNKESPLNHAFSAIRACRTHGPIHSLFLICHGVTGRDQKELVSREGIGGEGLALGLGGVQHSNVAQWISIRDMVQNIVVYACNAAETQAGYVGTANDGKYLMGALALHTRATVYAGDVAQVAMQSGAKSALEFGKWEGQLWRFRPDGCAGVPVAKAPVEYNEMLRGLYA